MVQGSDKDPFLGTAFGLVLPGGGPGVDLRKTREIISLGLACLCPLEKLEEVAREKFRR